LTPELYRSRFGAAKGPLYYILRALERRSFALADVVVATNESYRRIAIERGGKRPEDVFVVRNAPNLARFRPREPDPALKRGKPNLLAYVGVMGAQDGVDDGLRALARLKRMREDWHALLVGDGDVFEEMRGLAHELGLDDHVEFAGYLLEPDVIRVLSTADVCLSPEPSSPLNDVSTMMKVAEYMAMGRPLVCFDLAESRFTAGEAALYAPPGDEEAFARRLDELLSRPELREKLGALGRTRVEAELAWEHSERRLLAAYERALGPPS
jgi:glycosyltransferase involved in cell wall biosynthesis